MWDSRQHVTYIFDHQNELENHLKPFSDLNHDTLQELQDMMKEINPYAQAYMHVGDVMKDKPAEDVQLVLQTSQESIDPCRYNLPTGTDVAVIIPTDCGNDITSRDVVVYKSAKDHPEGLSLMNINVKHPVYDPLMYVLIFPYGDRGWEFGMYKSANRKNEQCSPMQYYKYRIMPQAGETFNVIHRMGRLFQQYIVDMYAKIELERLNYIRNHQTHLQAEVYQGLADAVQNSDSQVDGAHIGKKVILPSSFTGGARFQHQLYQDAMAIVH